MRIHPSAAKHGIAAEDALHAAERWVFESELGDDPRRVLRLGFDRSGRCLETVVPQTHDGDLLLIHAMVARAGHRALL
ncbi:toxin [Agrococcus terreus]|uniref:toxin n=1 Tax=Agrococcus terreus TaxID=574649 RepID=UPI00384EF107